MEKRVLIAVLLSIAVMYGYTILFPQPKTNQQKSETTQNVAVPQATVASGPVAVPSSPGTAVPAQSAQARDIPVENDVYSTVISTRNGAIKKFVLKKYKDVAGTSGKEIVLFDHTGQSGQTLASSYPGFLSETDVNFTANSDRLTLTGAESKTLELTATTANGIVIKNTYTFTGNNYPISLQQSVVNNSTQTVSGQLQLNLLTPVAKPKNDDGRFEVYGPATLSDAGVAFDATADLAKSEKTYDKGLKWSGFGDKYFLKAVIVKGAGISTVSLKDQNGILNQRFSSQKTDVNPGQTVNSSCNLFFGPKDIDILKSQSAELEGAIDLGWFAALAKPLLHSLKLFYRYFHNYGIAIIVITLILKILFFPLTHKSYKSMKEMQKLQPKMQELKDKFKDDRDGLNRSVMELYKTHKVNPLGGCLPMIVQIPVFFGLYKALMFSIELRHAPFVFWLQDLSAKDPYYVTPIIMGATMFIQQKMTPTNMDPVQAKMMLALPVVFTFMFLNFPSGLVLYWLVNNILTIAQQAYINRTLKEA